MLVDIIGTLILTFCTFTFIDKILDNNNFKLKFISVLVYSFITIMSYNLAQESIIRLLFNWIMFVIIIKFIYKEKILKSFIISFIIYLILMILEILGATIITIFVNCDIKNIANMDYINLFINLFSSIFLLIGCRVEILTNFITYITKITFNERNIKIMIMTIISFSITVALSYYLYYDSNFIVMFMTSLILILVYNSFVFLVVFDKKKIEDLKIKNSEMMGNLRTYEEMLANEKMKNHESKNNLLCLKGIIGKKSVKATDYIDTLIDEMIEEDKTIKELIVNIPSGGLQGLIYQKMIIMKQKNIEFLFNISRNVHVDDFEVLDNKMLCDICKVIGIFLDNSIEEVDKSKFKKIKINFYKEKDKFIITISNTFLNIIKLEKIYEKGYSTKGENRGHGLSIVKRIVDSNKKLVNLNKINKNLFTQVLEIKLK